MEKVLEKCEVVPHADDNLIFTDDKTDNLCHENLTKDMESINKWLMKNKLKLNYINMDNNIIFKITYI